MFCQFRPMRRLVRPLLVALTLTFTGCVILPIPIPPRGIEVGQQSGQLVVGETTRAEVHALIGPPAHRPGTRFDVWELERDPFHVHWVILFGGPGYATGGDFRTGRVVRSSLVVGYDADGRVDSWRWLDSDGRGQESGDAAPSSPLFALNRRLVWDAARVVMLPDDEALLVTTDEPHRLTIERIALTDGRRLGQWTGDPEGCRVPVAL